MMRGGATDLGAVDGRRARRERGRDAVIDAVFELLQEGRVPPPLDEVAARSGVSASSVFRYFDGLDDMQHQAFFRFRERFGHLLAVTDDAGGTASERIAAFVDRRLSLYEQVGMIMIVARLRALEYEPIAAAATEQRRLLADQVVRHIEPLLGGLTPASRADTIAVIDSITAPEAWALMQRTHERSTRQTKRAWIDAIVALIPHHEDDR